MTDTAEMLARLVAFNTTSSRSNLELIDFVQEHLVGAGATVRRVCNPSGRKAALHAVIGNPGAGGLAFSGHVDTVPVEGQRWCSDPFRLREEGGKLFGRGVVDMKGFVASCLAAVPDLVAMHLPRPVHLFISYDEEVDASGARRLVEEIGSAGWKPDLCIVGEPTGMAPVVAHKGKLVARGTAKGLAGHSSQPSLGVNAVHAAARAVAWAASLAERHEACGRFDNGFDPPYTTVHVGAMQGGTTVNIIPAEADFVMEWRTVPGDEAMAELDEMRRHIAAAIEPAMKAVDLGAGIELLAECWYPELSLDPVHSLVDLVRAAGATGPIGKVSYATEAGVYQNAGIPTLVCGPGSIAQAHKPDEWITRSELGACDRFVREAARTFGQSNWVPREASR